MQVGAVGAVVGADLGAEQQVMVVPLLSHSVPPNKLFGGTAHLLASIQVPRTEAQVKIGSELTSEEKRNGRIKKESAAKNILLREKTFFIFLLYLNHRRGNSALSTGLTENDSGSPCSETFAPTISRILSDASGMIG